MITSKNEQQDNLQIFKYNNATKTQNKKKIENKYISIISFGDLMV